MPSASPSLPAPRPHEAIVPHKYLIWQKSQLCQCCGKTHTWSEIFAVCSLPSTLGAGKDVTNLRRIDRPQYNLPIDRKIDRTTTVPFCHACHEPSLRDFPDPPAQPKARVAPSWQGSKTTDKRPAAPAKPARKITMADFLK